eukprot:SAG22_NODE_163_length_16829_cov_9.946204_8_plen_326_part_00
MAAAAPTATGPAAALPFGGFRPCIDLHDGRVKQIVGGSINGDEEGQVEENFVSDKPSTHYAELYRQHELPAGHVIKLGPGCEEPALAALRAWPGGLQIGGGITAENAASYLEAGASHVIVTSYVFRDGKLDEARLAEMVGAVGADRLVLDLSCRKKLHADGSVDGYYVVTDRWQTFTELRVEPETLTRLAEHCAEFLVHGVDVEGFSQGFERPLVELLGEHSPIPATYAGGARSLADCREVDVLGKGKVGLTIGSALDIFGGDVVFDEVVEWHRAGGPGRPARAGGGTGAQQAGGVAGDACDGGPVGWLRRTVASIFGGGGQAKL